LIDLFPAKGAGAAGERGEGGEKRKKAKSERGKAQRLSLSSLDLDLLDSRPLPLSTPRFSPG
jgi:hypothetical protein